MADNPISTKLKVPSIVVFFIAMFFLTVSLPINAQSKHQQKINKSIEAVMIAIETQGITPENALAKNISTLSTPLVHIDAAGRIHIYIHMFSLGEVELAELLEFEIDIEISNKDFAIVQGWAPFNRIDEIAALSFVRLVTPPSYGATRTGSVSTEGDSILKADQVRQLGIDGNVLNCMLD